MKVPIEYKSSEKYNAGVDVIYDDESKLQYAPFVYAANAQSGGDDGGDEEGEEEMVLIETTFKTGTGTAWYESEKSALEVLEMMLAGKAVGFHIPASTDYNNYEGVVYPTAGSYSGFDKTGAELKFNDSIGVHGITSAYTADNGNVCFEVYVE